MPDTRPIKLVVTNEAALRRLYGKRISIVRSAVRDLRAADKRRGIATRYIRLDSTQDAKRCRFRRVTRHLDEPAVKAAIDHLCRILSPRYVMILGGPDIVPHQTLRKGLDTTDDATVPTDLPYACDAPYSDDATRFLSPTRIVGRLPGVTGVRDPAALVAAIRVATRWRPRARRFFDRPLAVSVKIWRQATILSLLDVWGSAKDLQLVPPKSFRWTERQLARRAHFLNCHGVDSEGIFEGQDGDDFPLAHASPYLARKIREGTVAAAACCYGAQLYDPVRARSKEPIVNAYLRSGAYAYFGSSTAVWGNPFDAELGDLLCQLFFARVRTGLSAGRAVLEARRDYVKTHEPLQPLDVLTLAQFNLFGDPSVHPILPAGVTCAPVGVVPARVHGEFGRRELEQGTPPVEERDAFRDVRGSAIQKAIARVVERGMRSRLGKVGGTPGEIRTFTLKPRPALRAGGGPAEPPKSVHVASSEIGRNSRGRARKVLVVAQTRGARVVSWRVLHTKG